MSREIDALVAKHIFKFPFDCHGIINSYDNVPHYSTDIAAAWSVIEQMKDDYMNIEVSVEGEEVDCVIYLKIKDREYEKERLPYLSHRSSSAPMAICLAALKAKWIEVDEG